MHTTIPRGLVMDGRFALTKTASAILSISPDFYLHCTGVSQKDAMTPK
jgi:hypothetical protein